jgi:hypothetical protein
MPEKKSSQQLLLLLLLLLVVLFAYLYFFTGLIKHREDQPKPQPVPEALVKKHLPPRTGQKGAEPAMPGPGPRPAARTGEHGVAAPVPLAQPAKPAATAKEGAAEKPAASAPRTKPAQPAAPLRQPMPGKPAAPVPQAKGAQLAGGAVKEAKSAPADEKKPLPKRSAKAKEAREEAAGEKTAAAPEKKPKALAKPAAPAYTLEITSDLLESEMGPVMAKLKHAGITHVVKTKAHKGEPMHRLFLADFASRDEALEEFERLKPVAPNAFLLKENGRYAVYAGSYLREGKAASEQDRLLGKGVQLLLKCVTAPVAVLQVSAGIFADQAGADKAARSLKRAGLSVKVVKVAKVRK